MREVRAAIEASTVSGVEMAYSGRWCSPSAMASTPTSSASTASSTTCRIAAASETRAPSSSSGTSPKVSSPKVSSVMRFTPLKSGSPAGWRVERGRSGMDGVRCEELADTREDLAAEQLDGARSRSTRQIHDIVLEVEAAQLQVAGRRRDLVGDGLGRAYEQRPAVDLGLVPLPSGCVEAAFPRDLLDDRPPVQPPGLPCFVVGIRNEAE